MAMKICCDFCDSPILNGQNAGKRNPIFTLEIPGRPAISITTSAKMEGQSDPDLCFVCLRKAVLEA